MTWNNGNGTGRRFLQADAAGGQPRNTFAVNRHGQTKKGRQWLRLHDLPPPPPPPRNFGIPNRDGEQKTNGRTGYSWDLPATGQSGTAAQGAKTAGTNLAEETSSGVCHGLNNKSAVRAFLKRPYARQSRYPETSSPRSRG